MRVEPWRAGRKEWQKGVVKSRIDKRSYEVELPQGLLRRNRVHLRKSNEVPIKVEDDPDVVQAREQSSSETRQDTHEQAFPDTRVETFDQLCDPPPTVPDTTKSPGPLQAPTRRSAHASVSCPSVFQTMCLLKPKDSFQRTEFP